MKAWDEQLRNTKTFADVACRLAALDGVPPAEPADPEAASARVTGLIADLVEPAKTTALEKLGEGEQALGSGTAWLRAKLLPVDPGMRDVPAAASPAQASSFQRFIRGAA